MYEQLFGLKHHPFRMTSNPAVLYLSAQHREALAGLCYGLLDRKGLLVLIGQAGTGKTTMLARAIEALPAGRVYTSLISNPTLTLGEFLEMVLLGFGVRQVPASKPQRLLRLEALLVESQAQGKIAALVVDEAHTASGEVLEEIRLLGNLEREGQKLLQIVLAGQSELGETLNAEQMRQLKQRIAIRLSLRPLSPIETEEYVRYRWMRAGGGEAPFAPGTLELIARWSQGIPRLVNAICDNALIAAAGDGVTVVHPKQVFESCAELDLLEPDLNLPMVEAPTADPLLTL